MEINRLMRNIRAIVVLVLAIASTGCYHAVIETGLPAGGRVISKPWAHGFVYGLVPPAPVDATNVCKSGVSKVETQHSFLNSLAAILTWSLYTPIQVDITCAADRAGANRDDASASTAADAPPPSVTLVRFSRQTAPVEAARMRVPQPE